MSTSTEALLEFRQQPLLELVNSEENYVQQLVQVRETYMKVGFPEPPIVGQECLTRSASCKSDRHPKTRPKPPTPPPAELASKWRILWGNWLQLTEWHTQFVEKVRRAVANQPDTVPLLFLRSQARLRSMYMKYCENYPKAVTLVALHKTYFEDLRTYFFDKNDLLSRLMQPIQRATRYQLPMTEALKLTEQAGSADVDVWRDAVAVLKDLPNDVQLMLEAARIVGFPGSVTGQGNLRLFGAMYVAHLTQTQLHTAQTVAGHVLTTAGCSSLPLDTSPHAVKRRAMTSPSYAPLCADHNTTECSHCQLLAKCSKMALKSVEFHFTPCRVFLFDQSLLITEDNTSASHSNTSSSSSAASMSPEAACVGSSFQANFGSVVSGSASLAHRWSDNNGSGGGGGESGSRRRSDLSRRRSRQSVTPSNMDEELTVKHAFSQSYSGFSAGRSPALRRTIHVRRHTGHLHSLDVDVYATVGGGGGGGGGAGVTTSWPKHTWSTSHDPFRQSSYKFLHEVKVNKMTFLSHWLFPEVTSRPKLIDEPGMRQSVKMASPEPSADTESLSNPEVTIYTPPSTRARSQGESLSVLTRAGCRSPDWLWFAVVDESPGSSDVYVFDPGSESARTSWLRELTDIQQMQAEIQLALQNPRRFHYVSRVGRQAKTHSSSDVTFLFAGDRGCRNCFLSAHSSSTRLPVDASSTGSEDGPIHFRNISAPHTHENKLPSENRSLEGWAESDSSSQKGLILHFSANISNESSVPDIVQTPDDVFLAPFPPTSQSDEGNQDNNHLKLPVDTTRRSYTRRRSLSQGDADTSEERLAERSQLPRQHAIQVGTSSLSSSSGPSSVCEASTAPVDTCDAKSPSEDTGGAPGSHDVSPTDNPTRIRRRLFRWSIVDKSTLIETSKSPPGLLVATCTPQTSDRCTGRQRLGSVTPQLFRKPSLLFGSRKTSEPPKAPSMRMISRFRLSFRVGSHQTGLPAATSTDAV